MPFQSSEFAGQGLDNSASARLDDLFLDLTDQYAILNRHQLQQIDNSTLMRNAIKGFADTIAPLRKLRN
jgi:hypothetical protein